MEEGHRADVETWMRIAGQLIDEFKGIKAFFPWERGKRISWFDEDGGVGRVRKKRKSAELESKMEEISTRLLEHVAVPDDTPQLAESETGSVPPPESTEPRDFSKESFRGLEFEQWFYIFMQVGSCALTPLPFAIFEFFPLSDESAHY
jgi:general transcription factor 3C polypeptide 3 (transcription factor C subunit 4)